jgi:predicted nucleic acid-binding Zn finger protein
MALTIQVPSLTEVGQSYEIKRGRDGVLYCSCPAWRFQRKPAAERSCKHMRAVAQLLTEQVNQSRVRV